MGSGGMGISTVMTALASTSSPGRVHSMVVSEVLVQAYPSPRGRPGSTGGSSMETLTSSAASGPPLMTVTYTGMET